MVGMLGNSVSVNDVIQSLSVCVCVCVDVGAVI